MKAILVIDMPNNCEECKITYFQGHDEESSTCYSGDWSKRPSWCPLKPMPNDYPPYGKIREQNFYTEEESDAYEKGWNDCLEEIEK